MPHELVDELLAGVGSEQEIVGLRGLLSDLTKRLVERATEVDPTDHFGDERHHEPPEGLEHPEGSTSTTVSTEHRPGQVRTASAPRSAIQP